MVGQVHYENADNAAPIRTIVYFKASLTGDQPADVNNYKKGPASFLHESTVDQWFSESQFESYRQLGYHAALTSIGGTSAAIASLEFRDRPGTTNLRSALEKSVEGAPGIRVWISLCFS